MATTADMVSVPTSHAMPIGGPGAVFAINILPIDQLIDMDSVPIPDPIAGSIEEAYLYNYNININNTLGHNFRRNRGRIYRTMNIIEMELHNNNQTYPNFWYSLKCLCCKRGTTNVADGNGGNCTKVFVGCCILGLIIVTITLIISWNK
jgi:hypothetical protein